MPAGGPCVVPPGKRYQIMSGNVRLWGTTVLAVFVAFLFLLSGFAQAAEPSQAPRVGALRATLDPSGFPPANYTNVPISPLPAVPDTVPVVLNLTQYGTIPIPTGEWETVILRYTGYTAGTAYDYFQTVTIDHAMVYVAVNPEAGHWVAYANLSAYLAFFDGQTNITISGPHLGAGTNFEGIQDNYLALFFFPIPAGAPGPAHANIIEPLFAFQGDPASVPVTIPSDTSAVVLQMMAIGSEFWYSLNPDFTAVTTAIGGHNVSTYLQFPWINSGGIDLFAWRPIYPVNMLDHQWEDFNLTGALGLIEGTHNLTMTPADGSLGASVIANLLIYTSPSVHGARQLSYHYHQAPVVTTYAVNTSFDDNNPNGNDYTYYNQTDVISYGYASRILTDGGHFDVSLRTHEDYANAQAFTLVWQNITESEVVSSQQHTTYDERGLHGFSQSDQTLSYPLAMDLGAVINYLYSQGPDAYFSYVSYFDHVHQIYHEVDTTFSFLNGESSARYENLDQGIVDTNGYFQSVLEEGPGFAIIENITSSLHTTHKVFTEVLLNSEGDQVTGSYYHHVLAGREDNSTTYYVEETVLVNRVISFPIRIIGPSPVRW